MRLLGGCGLLILVDARTGSLPLLTEFQQPKGLARWFDRQGGQALRRLLPLSQSQPPAPFQLSGPSPRVPHEQEAPLFLLVLPNHVGRACFD